MTSNIRRSFHTLQSQFSSELCCEWITFVGVRDTYYARSIPLLRFSGAKRGIDRARGRGRAQRGRVSVRKMNVANRMYVDEFEMNSKSEECHKMKRMRALRNSKLRVYISFIFRGR